jgi:hypothetical protein
MMRTKRTLKLLCLLGLLALLTACTEKSFTVTFDGTECTLSGPREIKTGEYPFFVENLAEYTLKVYVRYLHDENTNLDFIGLQREPGMLFSIPNWASPSKSLYSSQEDVYIHFLDDVGEYSISLERGSDPHHIWICPPIQVVE